MTTPTVALNAQHIAETQGALRTLLDAALVGNGLTSNEYVTLIVLAVRGPYAAPADLHSYLISQRQLGLDADGVADLLAGMQAAGLASGTGLGDTGPSALTEAGGAALGQLRGVVGPLTQRVFAGFDPADLAIAAQVLTEVTARAEAIRQEL